MPESYLVLWAQDRCRLVKKAGDTGKMLQVLYGGPHISAPSFRRYGVAPGDWVNVGAFKDGVLYIVARMRVTAILGVGEYFRKHLGMSRPKPSYDALLSGETPTAPTVFGHQSPPDCVTEAVIGEEATPIRFDVAVPVDVLTALRFRNKRNQERGLKVVDGKLKGILGMQGHVMRFVPDSALAIEELVLLGPTSL